jgi:hypothetical protein
VTFTALTEEQWAAIWSLGDDLSPDIQWPAVRQEIEQAGRDFWLMRANRTQRPPVDERDRLKRALRDVRKIQRALPDLASIAHLAVVERDIENQLTVYEVWASKFFKSQADAHKALLYYRLLLMWTELGGELQFSRDVYDKPTGPLVQFLMVALGAILGEESPGPAGVGSIIERERHRRRQRRLASVLKRWKNFKP